MFTVFVNQFFIHLQYIYVVDYTKLVTRFVQFVFRVRGVWRVIIGRNYIPIRTLLNNKNILFLLQYYICSFTIIYIILIFYFP